MLTIPNKLKRPLEGSAFEAATLHFAEASWLILKDNQMPFFPAYTDHGCDHIQCVLDAAVQLIPDDVWAQDLIQPADASVLICSTLLHDLGLHVRAAGFREIIAASSPFKPLHWFDTVQATRSPDKPWEPLWNAFRKEARHFTKSQLDRLLGPEHSGVPAIAFGDTTPDPGAWTQADHLLVGEFLRRHHARLAHEIAMYGFPGATAETYPRLGEAMPDLANAVGLVARSHNEPMRTCLDYLDYLQPGNRRPFGALAPYLIGLLRIADYFQLEAKRAPPLLLHLKDPQSPQSIEEWNKHGAVGPISWSVTDPLAVYIETVPAHGLRTHLQLSELFGDLQQELDTTTAVLSETYPMPPLSSLRLARQRIRTNLDEPSFHAQLSYVAKKASLRSAEDLFRLVVGDLYGNQPAVAGRELIQNAVDAVRERRRWESHFGIVTDDVLFREQRADVQVRLLKEPTGLSLCVADRGIGMTAEAAITYFLTAGATFSLLENDANSDRAIAISHLKAGRFGIGAFAAFLLGPEMRVTTRHIGADRGITFVARIDDDLVQLDWADAPFGTEVVVPFSPGSEHAELDGSSLVEFFARIHSFYRLPDPTIAFELVRPGAETVSWGGRSDVPIPSSNAPSPDEWRSISAAGFDHVSWRAAEPDHDFVYDGIGVEDPAAPAGGRAIYRWSDRQIEQLIETPDLAVFDSRHLLGISLNRYQLSERTLPFEESLLYSIGLDIVAYALVAATTEHALGKGWGLKGVFTKDTQLPFLPGLLQRYLKTDLCVLWLSPDSYQGIERPLIDSSLFWLSFPTRVALRPPRKLHRRAWEKSTEGLGLADVDAWTRVLGKMLDCDTIASVGMSNGVALFEQTASTVGWRSWPPDLSDDDAPTAALYEEDDDYLADFDDQEQALPAPVNYACWRYEQDEQATSRLCQLGDYLLENSALGTVGLSLLRIRDHSRSTLDPVSQAWDDTVGGALSRGHDEMDVIRQTIYERHPEIRESIDKWRRVWESRRDDAQSYRRVVLPDSLHGPGSISR